jgi:putative colanic acid biosynthesis glycosyltransferase
MSQPFFSIITVVRNNIEGLKRTKSTVESQTCKSWEWIIIDGNSDDGTGQFALGCIGTKIKAVSEKDRGIYDAMNKGLCAASGAYVIFLNGGDLFANETVLGAVKDDLEREPVDVLFGGSSMHFGIVVLPRPARHPSYIWHGQPGLHQATFFNRVLHQRIPYDISYRICGDYDVLTRMWAAKLRFRSSSTIVSVNEFVAQATSGRNKIALMKEAIRAQRHNLRLPFMTIMASLVLRVAKSGAAKALTITHALLQRVHDRRLTISPKVEGRQGPENHKRAGSDTELESRQMPADNCENIS